MMKLHEFIASISVSLALVTANFNSAQPAKAIPIVDDILKPVLGRCGVAGEATITVHYLIPPQRGGKIYVEVEKEGKLAGVTGKEIGVGLGKSFSTGICNRDGFRVKIYTPEECGKTLLAESRYSRVYNKEDVWIKEDGITLMTGDTLNYFAEAGKFTLKLISAFQTGGATSPLVLEAAEKFAPCFTNSPGCPAGPDEFKRIAADRCLAQTFTEVRRRANASIQSALRQQAADLYRTILGREPEAGAAEGLASRLANGSTLARERQNMANSEESRNNLANLYRTILGREPEAGAVDGLVSRLANGSTLAQEREIMANSEEARRRRGL